MRAIITILLFVSCQSSDPMPTWCWKCTTTIIIKLTPASAAVISSEKNICGFTDSQINDLERVGTIDEPSAFTAIKCERN